ncbi:MAG: biotin transporter BioY [Bacillota bacterium]
MSVKKLTIVAMFAALTAVGAFIKIPLPYSPITLQVFFVVLAGVLLGPRLAGLSQLVYLLLGLVGLPIFAEGGGPGYIFHPTFGFLLGFIPMSMFIGYAVHKDEKLAFGKILAVGIIGIVILYAIGVPYLNLIINRVIGKEVALLTTFKGMLLFVPGDILKVIGVALIAPRIKAAVEEII